MTAAGIRPAAQFQTTMRTAIILLVDAKGVPKVVANGPYDKTKAEAAPVIGKLKPGEAAWIVASGFTPKIFKGPKPAKATKEDK